MMSSFGALAALNFFMADVRDGLGPFLGVFLQQNGWNAAAIGGVMTLAGMAAVVLTTPLGVFVDQTRAKRAMLVACALLIITACGINFFAPAFALTAAAQTVTAVAGAAILPLIASVTLGLVGQAGYPRQLGRNAAFRHAGTATSALLAGGLGYLFGLAAVFVLMGVMAIGAIMATVMIRERDIDHEAARGGIVGQAPAPLWPALAGTPGLLVLAATVALFHLANAAMLPLLGQSMVARGSAGDGAAYQPVGFAFRRVGGRLRVGGSRLPQAV
jgi:predicted MFS family arabinose efflux permease